MTLSTFFLFTFRVRARALCRKTLWGMRIQPIRERRSSAFSRVSGIDGMKRPRAMHEKDGFERRRVYKNEADMTPIRTEKKFSSCWVLRAFSERKRKESVNVTRTPIQMGSFRRRFSATFPT